MWDIIAKILGRTNPEVDKDLELRKILELEARNLEGNLPKEKSLRVLDPAAIRELGSEEVNPTTVGYYIDKRGYPKRTTFGKDAPVNRYLTQYPRDYVETRSQLMMNDPTVSEYQFNNWVELQKKLAKINATKAREYKRSEEK